MIRTEIKRLSEAQRELKPQRKEKKFKGTRTVPSGVATARVLNNRYELRHLYHAYARAKGITLPAPKRKELSPSKVDKLFAKYFPDKAA